MSEMRSPAESSCPVELGVVGADAPGDPFAGEEERAGQVSRTVISVTLDLHRPGILKQITCRAKCGREWRDMRGREEDRRHFFSPRGVFR